MKYMIDGTQLRKETLAARNRLSKDEIATQSKNICALLLGMPAIKEATCLFVYVNFRSEVATEKLIDELLSMGKEVTVPVTRVQEKRLDAIRISDRHRDLVPGYCDIPEPREELWTTQLVPPSHIDTILLPGSVFDRRGGRFGYGGGFYDRFVAAVPHATRIGLAFNLQLVDLAPLAPHDELLDYVVTDKSVVLCGRRK
jgi:5-formyltetrahydrofolate cyclo-ligase